MNRMNKQRKCPVFTTGILLAVSGLLAGCQSLPSGGGFIATNSETSGQADEKSAELTRFLSSAPAGQVRVLEESPWGAEVTVMLQTQYFAASGRNCARITIEDAGSEHNGPALVCEQSDGQWLPVKRLAN